MGARQLFQMDPWRGGLNTSADPSKIGFNELTRADHLVFNAQDSRQKRPAINFDWDDATSGSDAIVGGADFHYGNTSSRTNVKIGVTSGKNVYAYSTSGGRGADIFAGTAWATTPTVAHCVVLNNKLVITSDGGVPKSYDGATFQDLAGSPPSATWCHVHKGRVIMNDRSNPDLLHYSPPNDCETWGGIGDSGGIPIATGDGDPIGLTGAFTFNDVLYVGKRNRLYRLEGDFPDIRVVEISRGIGIESHASIINIEDTDVAFASQRGFHLLSATDTAADFQSEFLSKKIQTEFNDDFVRARLKYIKGCYAPTLNSIVFAVTHGDYGSTRNNCLYLYNFDQGWYRWPAVSCETLFASDDSDKKRFYLGTATTRLALALHTTTYDIDETGAQTSIPLDIQSGRITLDGSLVTLKGFKAFYLMYEGLGSHTITVSFTVDRAAAQDLTFTDTSGGDLLGSTFVLGQSILGSTMATDAFGIGVDGLGSSFQVRVRQSGATEASNIIGFAVEYEPVGHAQEAAE